MKKYHTFIFILSILLLILIACGKEEDKSKLDELRKATQLCANPPANYGVPCGDGGIIQCDGTCSKGLGVCQAFEPAPGAIPLIEPCASFGINCTEGTIATDPEACGRGPQIHCTCPDPLVCQLTINTSIIDPDTKEVTENRYIGRCTGTPLPLEPTSLTISFTKSLVVIDGKEIKFIDLKWKHIKRSFEKINFTVYRNENDGSFALNAGTDDQFYNETGDTDKKYGYYVTALSQYGESNSSDTVYVFPDKQSNK